MQLLKIGRPIVHAVLKISGMSHVKVAHGVRALLSTSS